jgi:LmbE family N-acetylglucosaminyl deacetylase
MKSALVIAAHPDDEVLGCGGTIARLASEGWAVHVLIVAEGATSRDDSRNRGARAGELSELAQAAQAANAILGAASVVLGDLPDNRMDSVDLLDIVKTVEQAVARHRPSRVFTHHAGDLNIDHRLLHDAVLTACRPLPGSVVEELLFFEVASSTEWTPAASGPSFAPTVFYDISGHLDRKLAALEAYASEMRPFPHARSVTALAALARWRGASCGFEAAEAFALGRARR